MSEHIRIYRWLCFFCLISLAETGWAETMTIRVAARDGSSVMNAVVSSGSTVEAATPRAAIMDQIDKTFEPHVLAVPVGAAVTFPNSDQIRHHVYSFSEPKSFELRLYSGTPELPVEFDKPGVVVVGCNIHDNMIGYIYISPREHWAVTGDSGEARLDVSGTAIHVWHPDLSLDARLELTFDVDEADRAAGVLVVHLPIEPPDPHPQSVRGTDHGKFRQFLDH